jgi:hypothetical protein
MNSLSLAREVEDTHKGMRHKTQREAKDYHLNALKEEKKKRTFVLCRVATKQHSTDAENETVIDKQITNDILLCL